MTPTIQASAPREAPPIPRTSADAPLTPLRSKLAVARLLLAGDTLALILALLVGAGAPRGPSAILSDTAAIALTLLLARALGVYDNDHRRAEHTTVDEIFAVCQAVTISAWLLLALAVALKTHVTLDSDLPTLWLLSIAALLSSRLFVRTLCARMGLCRQRTIILGAGQVGQAIARKLMRNPGLGLELVGFIDGEPLALGGELRGLPILGSLPDADRILRESGAERVIVAFSSDCEAQILGLVRGAAERGLRVDVVPRLFESLGLQASLHTLEGLPLVSLHTREPTRFSLGLKRALDIALGSLGLLALMPLLMLIAFAVKLDSRGPVLYLNERVGRGGRRFRLCKFRTMHLHACRGERYGADGAEQLFQALMDDPLQEAEFERTHKLRRDPRVTRLGALLRRTSLDELPQLVNVIRGELSLVGPRPVMAYEVQKLERIIRGEHRRGEDSITLARPFGYWETDRLRPGMTGYWQVTARSSVSYEERLRLDLIYTTSWSLRLDLLIFIRTLGALAGQGAH